MNNKNITFLVSEKIKKASRDYSLFDASKKILVALSGGADSCSLLITLKELSKELGFEISAVHINHMIRGKEADRDEEFAKNLCKRYEVEFFSYHIDIPTLAKKTGQSTELCARNERYRIFSELSLSHGFDAVATAHTASDNAETVLFNLARGSGIKGLCGIPPKRKLSDNVDLIRPLIYLTRSEVEKYLEALGENYVTDSTNLSDDYTRNYIRHEIIPRFCKINPSFEGSVSRSSYLLSEDSNNLEKSAEESVTDNVRILAELPEGIRSRVVMLMYSRVCTETPSLVNVRDVSEMIKNAKTEKVSVSLPGRIRAVCENGRFFFENDKACQETQYDVPLCMGKNVTPDGQYVVFLSAGLHDCSPDVLNYKEIIYKKYNTAYLYSDKIIDNLQMRNRRNGDVLETCGMKKSVKRLLCERKIPTLQRNNMPFVCADGKIICIPCVGISDDFLKREERQKVLTVEFYKSSTL